MKLKLSKKIVSMLLIFIFLFTFTTTAYASNEPLNKYSSIYCNISNALNSLDSNLYGLNNIDYSQLTVGNEINSYEYTNSALKILDYKIYPLSYNQKLIAFAIKYNTSDSIQITTNLVNEVSANINSDIPFALIYDRNSCYIYTEKELILLHNTQEVSDRDDLNNVSDKAFLKQSILNVYAPNESLENYTNNTYSPLDPSTSTSATDYLNATSSYSPAYITCSVSFVSQNPPSDYCWACCDACIGNSITGKNYTGINVATALWGSDYNHGASGDTAMVVLNSLYDTTYIYHSSVPSDSVIYNSISNKKPLYSSWSFTGGSHATVIYGINTTNGYIYVMDPEYGFESALFSGSTYTFTSLHSGVKLTLTGYGA